MLDFFILSCLCLNFALGVYLLFAVRTNTIFTKEVINKLKNIEDTKNIDELDHRRALLARLSEVQNIRFSNASKRR